MQIDSKHRKAIQIEFWIPFVKSNKTAHTNINSCLFFYGLNMFLFPINIPIFPFTPSKFFFQLLVPIKFSITTFGPYF